MGKDALPAPGTVYTFPLKNGQHGACRVLRSAGKDEAQFAGHSLVYGTQWVGEPAAALKHPDTKKIIKGLSGPALYWVKGGAPSSFTQAGVVAVTKAEQGKGCMSSAPWGVECGRIAKGEKGNAADAVFGISGPAMRTIFDEFCTPKKRPYGRNGGSYSTPPEYQPRDAMGEVKMVNARRAEIETSRGGRAPERVTYVLLKVGGAWLVDSKTRDGIKATL